MDFVKYKTRYMFVDKLDVSINCTDSKLFNFCN